METFDLRRRCALYLTYYRYGDTRKRGMAMLAFKAAYRAAGLEPVKRREAGGSFRTTCRWCWTSPHCTRAARNCCAPTVPTWNCCCARCGTSGLRTLTSSRRSARNFPGLHRRDQALVLRFWDSGPPAEEVGLEPFAPPGYLTGTETSPMSSTSAWQVFVWVALPYLALGIFAVGHIWRWRYDQFGWTSRSTQLQERRLLKWGSPIFHYGTFAAIAGHVTGVLIPERWTHAIGIPETAYRWFSAAAGTLAAVLIIAGVVILAGRRLLVPRVRATTSPVDYMALILLLIIIITGIVPTLFVNLLGHGYDYRTTVAPWFRGLFSGSPDVAAIASAPVIYQVHAASAWLIWAVWPFSRLVHAWSVPLWYLWRPYIVYRSRRAVPPAEPGTSGRRWRKIGVPY